LLAVSSTIQVTNYLPYSATRRRGLTQRHAVVLLAIAGAGLVLASLLAPRIQSYLRSQRDIAAEAKDYLKQRNVQPLEQNLDTLLAEAKSTSIPSLPHPLQSQTAPGFELSDHNGRQHTLAEHVERGPVVLVFYYGYYCNHCVSQLFALQDDLAKFHQLGAEVIALSADTPQQTTEKFAKYGPFTYPVLADLGNKTAIEYSIFTPSAAGKPERLLHGTFIIDKQGVVRWCHYGEAPFTANATLLVELAKLQATAAGPTE
jgi:peroxiredoxin